MLTEEGTDVLAAYVGENSSDNSLVYQSLFYVLSKGVEFILPTLLSASFGDPTAFTLGLIRRDISSIQKDLDYFREIPFHQIKYLIEEVKEDCDDEENHYDAYEKFRQIERKSIEAIFSSKKFEHKIKAAEISFLAKSYIKRFNHDTRVFDELSALEEPKKKSLTSQMMKLLTEIVQMPNYLEALDKAKDAWYRMETTIMENQSIVDQVDSLKISVYTNSVLCDPKIQESRTYLFHGEAVLVKTWNLWRNMVPEGERQALETSLTHEDLSTMFSAESDNMIEFEDHDVEQNGLEEEEDEIDYDAIDDMFNSGSESSSDEELEELPHYFRDQSEDEVLSDEEDNVDEDELKEENDGLSPTRQISVYEMNSVETFGTRSDTFRIYSDLHGTIFIKAGIRCKLFINGEMVEESDVVQSAWRIEDPSDILHLEFLIMKEDLKIQRNISIRKLNLTEEVGMELIKMLSGSNEHCNHRAENCLHCGTVTMVQWNVPTSDIIDCLETERDIQSPLFQPLPLDHSQPYFKTIIDGRMRKAGIKKFGWTGRSHHPLVAGMLVWNKDAGTISSVGGLKTLSKKVKDLQMKDIDWSHLEYSSYVQIDTFLFSYMTCSEDQ